jgi:PAS domain S-box-containing protein
VTPGENKPTTQRGGATQRLSESEQRFSTLVENSPDVIARLDRNLRYIYISPGLQNAIGVSPDKIVGKTPSEVELKDYDGQSFEMICREAIDEKKTVHRAAGFGDKHFWTRIVPELNDDGEVESLMMISQDVTDRVRAETEFNQLTGQMFRLQDEERRRIARELHDGTAQNLFGISVNLAKLNQIIHGTTEAEVLIKECESLGDRSLQEIRTLSCLLHPPLLDEAGLVSALQWYAQGFSKRSGIQVDVIAQPLERLPPDHELALFRVVQESLTNVRRHSGSATACIRLESKLGEVFLKIEDNGSGLTVSKQPSNSEDSDEFIQMGVGIPGMRQRLLQLGGRLEVTSSNQGATVPRFCR